MIGPIQHLSADKLILETDRLVMTPLIEEDVDIMTQLLCNADVMRFVTDAPKAKENVTRDMKNAVRRGAGGRVGIWCIREKETGGKVGDAVLMPVPIEHDHYQWHSVVPEVYPPAQIEVGYLFLPSVWGRGYATEACARLLAFAFEETTLDEIVATTDPENAKSQNVLRKCGLRAIGRKRAFAWDDVDWFEITRAEWMAQESNQ